MVVVEVNECEFFVFFSFLSCRPEKRCNPERGADIYPNLLQLSSLACASTNSRHPEKVWIEMQAIYLWSLNDKHHHVDMCVHTHRALEIAECLGL